MCLELISYGGGRITFKGSRRPQYDMGSDQRNEIELFLMDSSLGLYAGPVLQQLINGIQPQTEFANFLYRLIRPQAWDILRGTDTEKSVRELNSILLQFLQQFSSREQRMIVCDTTLRMQ